MRIFGFQKLSLLDFPGRMAAIVFTGGCNFRCPFCHNASLVTAISPAEEIDAKEVFSYLEKRKGLLDGLVLTGGEPLLQSGVEEFLVRVRALGYAIKLDTNGAYPGRLKALVEGGLVDYVAMDVKNSAARYGETVGIETLDLAPIEESIDFLLSGVVDYEFRTTVVRELHTVADLTALAERIGGARRYFLQAFLDSGNLLGEGMHAYSGEEMRDLLRAVRKFVPPAELRGI